MTALDTSVCIPALVSWHEHHDASLAAAQGSVIPAHALLETYSVLTRLPSPHRLDGETTAALLGSWFTGERVLASPASLQRRVVGTLASAGLEGGAVYDAMIGLTAFHHGHVLLTRDRRAAGTYDRLGIEFVLLDDN